MIGQAPVCLECKHLYLVKGFKCAAFPKGIPDIILFGKNKHLHPLPDQDNEIVFLHNNSKTP